MCVCVCVCIHRPRLLFDKRESSLPLPLLCLSIRGALRRCSLCSAATICLQSLLHHRLQRCCITHTLLPYHLIVQLQYGSQSRDIIHRNTAMSRKVTGRENQWPLSRWRSVAFTNRVALDWWVVSIFQGRKSRLSFDIRSVLDPSNIS